ncbi:sensor histidine kinase [Nocardia sp. NPDC004722]
MNTGQGSLATTHGRLRRTRLLLTALFTALTAISLIVLGAVAATIDDHSRQQTLDGSVDRVVTGLVRAIRWDDDGDIDLDAFHYDDLAQGEIAVAVVARDPDGELHEVFIHQRSALPADLLEDAQAVAEDGDAVVETLTTRSGHRTRVAAVPVLNAEENAIGAVIFAATDPTPSERDHQRLVLALELGGLVLIALAALAGHLLSGLSMRPAMRVLDEQERFLSEAAHELRTPLATLRLYLDAALRDPDDARRAVTDARSLTDRMGRLVTGLLTRTRTETGLGELDLQQLHLDQLVEGVVSECGITEIEVHTEPTVVRADPDMLALAVRNLIDNALLHGGTPIEVTVAAGAVSVRDHGPGLDASLTDPFERGAIGSSGRHGIGLSIVRWVAQAHSGSVTIGSAAGGGAIATLTLPEVRE